jgi:hypothetical protein
VTDGPQAAVELVLAERLVKLRSTIDVTSPDLDPISLPGNPADVEIAVRQALKFVRILVKALGWDLDSIDLVNLRQQFTVTEKLVEEARREESIAIVERDRPREQAARERAEELMTGPLIGDVPAYNPPWGVRDEIAEATAKLMTMRPAVAGAVSVTDLPPLTVIRTLDEAIDDAKSEAAAILKRDGYPLGMLIEILDRVEAKTADQKAIVLTLPPDVAADHLDKLRGVVESYVTRGGRRFWWPLIGVCNELYGQDPNASNLRLIRGRICAEHGLTVEQADELRAALVVAMLKTNGSATGPVVKLPPSPKTVKEPLEWKRKARELELEGWKPKDIMRAVRKAQGTLSKGLKEMRAWEEYLAQLREYEQRLAQLNGQASDSKEAS